MTDSAGRAVFLSYASQDAGAAQRICAALRAAGVEVWFDQDGGLAGGDVWDRKIREHIQACALFVPVISANTHARKEGYFRMEWKLAAQRTHAMADGLPFLLPVVIDGSHDADALVPAEFKAVQWTKLPDGETPPAFTGRVQRILAGTTEAGSTRSPGHSPTVAAPPLPRDQNFWIAVLPFKHRGTASELAALAEGMSEDVVIGLSRFQFLRVIAKGSTARYAQETVDIRTVGHELGARYVIEGSLRQTGAKLRVAVQLVDVTTGSNLWAEQYDRAFSPEAVFDLQDDLVSRIVATVADASGVLVHNISDAVRTRDPMQLSPHEAIWRFCGFGEHYTPAEHELLRNLLERIVEQVPTNGFCWGGLSFLYTTEYTEGFNARPEPLERAYAAAHRAITFAPGNSWCHYVLARCLLLQGEFGAFRAAAERAISLNPHDCVTVALLGGHYTWVGDWSHGCAMIKRAHELNPHHPGWYWFPDALNAYRQGDYGTALEVALKINMPGYQLAEVVLAATYAQLGQLPAAGSALRRLLQVRPDFSANARLQVSKLCSPDLVESILEGLRKAGLEITAPVDR